MIDPTMISLPAAALKGKGGTAAPAADLKADPKAAEGGKADGHAEPFAALLGSEATAPADAKNPKGAKAQAADSDNTPTAEELAAAIAAAAAALAAQPAPAAAPAAATPDTAVATVAAASVADAAAVLKAQAGAAAPLELAAADVKDAQAAPGKADPAAADALKAEATKTVATVKQAGDKDAVELAPAAAPAAGTAAPAAATAPVAEQPAADVTTLAPAPATSGQSAAAVVPAPLTPDAPADAAAAVVVAAAATVADIPAAKKTAQPAPATAKAAPVHETEVSAVAPASPTAQPVTPNAAPATVSQKDDPKNLVADVRHVEHETGDNDQADAAPVKTDGKAAQPDTAQVALTTISHADRSEFARIIGSVSAERVPAGKIPEAVVNHVSELGKQGGGEIVFRLDPPGLGQLQIHVTVVDGKVDASIVASSSQVATALQQSLTDLTTAIAERGLDIGSFNVGADAAGGSRGREQNANGRRSSGRRDSADTSVGSTAPSTRLTAASSLTQLDVLA